MLKGNKYGIHRVIEPQGVLTQAAKKIDNDMTKRYSNEIICDVISLNIDSASFTQIEEACNKDVEKIGQMILDIVNERGKMQNPVTGSGGMFIGTVSYIGEELDTDIKVGDKIASLVSLSMTPLKIDKSTEWISKDRLYYLKAHYMQNFLKIFLSLLHLQLWM